MRREILILDVTAMSGDNVCVAGIDMDSSETIRLNRPQPNREQLKSLGWLQPGEVIAIDVNPILSVARPHVEDHEWNPRSIEKRRRLSDDEVYARILSTAFDSVEEAFGPPLRRGFKRNSPWKPGEGERSLATMRVR